MSRLSITGEYRALLALGLPILVSQIGSVATGFADNVMVGRYSTEALAAASFCNNVFNVAVLACIGFSMGITPLVGVLHARGDTRAIGSTVRMALWLNLAFTLLVTAIMSVLYLNLDRLGQPAELLPLIRPYYIFCLLGMVMAAVYFVFSQWSYAIGNTRMPMWIILIGNAVNVVGNWLLIYGECGCPELGLTGAAISTFSVRTGCAVVIALIFFMKAGNRPYRDGWRAGRLTRQRALKVVRTSLPVSLQMTCETGSFSVSAIFCGWLGTLQLAAFQIVMVVGMLGFCVYYAIGSAVAVRVANANGAGDREGMRRSARAGYRIILAIMVVASITFVVAGRPLLSIFTADPAVLAMAVTLIAPMVLYQLGDATQVNFANALRGTGHVMPMLWISLASYVIVGIPATYLMCFATGWGVQGIVASFSVSLFMAGALYLYFFVRATRRPG